MKSGAKPGEHGLDYFRRIETDDDAVADGQWVVAPGRAVGEHFVGFPARAIPHRDAVAVFEQPLRDGGAHQAEANNADAFARLRRCVSHHGFHVWVTIVGSGNRAKVRATRRG